MPRILTPNPEETKFLNIADAARYLSVSTQTLRAWIDQRRIGHVRIGKFVRLEFDELDRFIAANTTEPVAQTDTPNEEHV
jgi:excisionase family DNA binding protein